MELRLDLVSLTLTCSAIDSTCSSVSEAVTSEPSESSLVVFEWVHSISFQVARTRADG